MAERSRFRQLVSGFASLFGVLVVVGALPVVFVSYRGSRMPDQGEVSGYLHGNGQLPTESVLAVLFWLGVAAWSLAVVFLALEIVAYRRRRQAARIPGMGRVQALGEQAVKSIAGLALVLGSMRAAVPTMAASPEPSVLAVAKSPRWAGPAPTVAQRGVHIPSRRAVVAVAERDGEAPAASPASVVLPSIPGRVIPAGTKVYTVVHRRVPETLWAIAVRHLGDGRRYRDIVDLNEGQPQPGGRRVGDPHWIYPGWVLVMPADAVGVPVVAAPDVPPTPVPPPAPSVSEPLSGGPGAATAAPSALPSSAGDASTGVSATQSPTSPAAPPSNGHVGGQDRGRRRPRPISGGPRQAMSNPTNPPSSSRSRPTAPVASSRTALPGTNGSSSGDGLPAAPEPGRTDRAPRHGGALPLPAELIGAGLLSAGLVALIKRRTDVQRARRRAGRRIPRPTGDQARVELAARIGADDDGATFVDAGLRYLALGVRAMGCEAPVIIGAERHPDRLVVLLASACEERPAGFEPGDDELSWALPRPDDMAAFKELVDDVVAPLPTMVTVGRSGSDDEITVMMNPESVGVIAIDGDCYAARQVVASVAAELATAAWSQLARVYLVGFGRPDGLGDTDATILADSVEECLPRLRSNAAEMRSRARDQTKASAAALLMHGDGADLGPSLLLCVYPPSAQALAELAGLAADPTCGVSAVIAGDIGDAVTPGWALEIDAANDMDVGPLGHRVRPQRVPYEIFEAIEGRIRVATDPADVAADELPEHWYPAEADERDGWGDAVEGDEADTQGVDDEFADHGGDRDTATYGPASAPAAGEIDDGNWAAAPAAAKLHVDGRGDDNQPDVDDAALLGAVRQLATLPVPIPEHLRHPKVLVQVLGPRPRVLRIGESRMTEIVFGRTRSLEAVVYKAFYRDASNQQLATILSAGRRPPAAKTRDGAGDDRGYNLNTFATTLNVARKALGLDAAGNDLLSTRAAGRGRSMLSDDVVSSWDIFRVLKNAAEEVDMDTRIQVLSTALDLVGAGGPFGDVPLGSADKVWKWIECGPSNVRGEMEAAILDAAHWLAELCLERGDFHGVREAVEKGRSITDLDQSINCDLLDVELSANGEAALEVAFATIYAGYERHSSPEESDDPVAPEVREHYLDLKRNGTAFGAASHNGGGLAASG